ncbi:MAG: DUF2726 domain-containing protein [Phycisphaeraceae bacterium]|nr:DUF2726 domain-containing protein [Phycisphaeraceae bacterium]
MKTLLVLLPLLLLIGALALLVKLLEAKKGIRAKDASEEPGSSDGPLPYRRRDASVLTPAEQRFFAALEQAVAQISGGKGRVLAQIPLSRLIEANAGDASERQRAHNKIDRKSVDFVVVDSGFNVRAAIELDDASHGRQSRKERDEFVEKACAAAGVVLVRCAARRSTTWVLLLRSWRKRWAQLLSPKGWKSIAGGQRGQAERDPGVGTPNPCTPKVQDEPVSSRLRRLQCVQKKPLRGKPYRGCRDSRLRRPGSTPGYVQAALRAAQITSTESVLELTISVAWYVVIVVPHAPFRVRTTDRFGLACCATQILPFVGCREHVGCSTSAREVGCDPMGVWRADWTSRRRAMLLRRRNRQTPLRDHDPSIFHRC